MFKKYVALVLVAFIFGGKNESIGVTSFDIFGLGFVAVGRRMLIDTKDGVNVVDFVSVRKWKLMFSFYG